jgi:hypothetical protein
LGQHAPPVELFDEPRLAVAHREPRAGVERRAAELPRACSPRRS